MTTTKEVLERAQDVIRDPNAWVRNYWATTRDGVSVEVTDQRACRFCATGALCKTVLALPNHEWYLFREAEVILDNVARRQGFVGIMSLNDHSDHETVLRAFQTAIDSLTPREPGI